MVEVSTLVAGIATAALWELVWKALAMWKAARNKQLAWFIVILVVNTLGILSIVYILFFQRKRGIEKRAMLRQARKQAKRRK